MAGSYWMYSDPRNQPNIPAAAPSAAALVAAAALPTALPATGMPPLKRHHPDYDAPTGSEQLGHYPRGDVRPTMNSMTNLDSINASYDQYLRNGMSSVGALESSRALPDAMPVRPADDSHSLGARVIDNRTSAYSGGRSEPPIPRDATNTLFVEGLPANCSRREVSHIFRPFIGFREVRIVTKDSKRPGGDPFVLCFVDFANASQAATALDALQGYKFDEHDRDSERLRIQFSHSPGPKSGSGGGPRGRRY